MIEFSEILIEEIADYLDSGLVCLYNKKTKDLMTMSEFEEHPDSDEINWDDIIEFQSMNSNEAFDVMADFVEQLNNSTLKENLIKILTKSKPFKNFKLHIDNSGEYRQQWFDFKRSKYIEYVKSQMETINEDTNSDFNIEEEIDFEDWEADADHYNRKDYSGLLETQKARALKNPTDLHQQEKYAIALNLNKKYEETLKLLEPLYKKHYDCGFGINEIMKALLGLNKTEKDFKWIKKPLILRLDDKTLDLIKEFLKGKRKPFSISEIYQYLLVKANYLLFNEEELSYFLIKFVDVIDSIGNTSNFPNSKKKLNKK